MPAFTHHEGAVFWDAQIVCPCQTIALAHELRDFADSHFFAGDFAAFEQTVRVRDSLIAAIQAANRWAEASA